MSVDQQPGTSFQSNNISKADSLFVEETTNKNYEVILNEEDITAIAKIEYGWFGENGRVLFKVIGSRKLEAQLGNYKDLLNDQTLTYIVDLNYNHWVTIVIANQNQQFSAYYVDSLGKKIPDNIQKLLKNVASNVKDFKIKQQHDKCNCGIFALENAKVINEALDKSIDPQAAVSNLQLTDDILKSLREEYAIALPRRSKIESKFNVLLKFLQCLNKQKEKVIKNFNYENANILLLFLETLAFQDPTLETSGSPNSPSALLSYLQKLVDQGIIDNDDLKCVRYIRSKKIFHPEHCSTVKPSDFTGIVNIDQDNGMKKLFEDLEKYVQQTCSKLQGKMTDDSNLKKLKGLFKSQKEIHVFGKTITPNQKKQEIIAFFKNATAKECYEDGRLTLENANKIMFHFVVNIIPYIDEKKESALNEIKWFRGSLIHKFYEFGDNYKLMGLALKNQLRTYGPYFFKYYYSQKVCSAFQKIKDKKVEYIEKYIRDLLNKFQNKCGKDYYAIKVNVDKKNTFEFVISKLVHSEVNSKSGLDDCVHEYFKLMSVIDNEEAIEARTKKYFGSGVPARYKELSANDRREIYEKFKELKKMVKEKIPGSEDNYENRKKDLLKKFKGLYGISKDQFNAMIKLYIENDASIGGEDIVTNALNIFMKIKEGLPNLSNEVIISKFNERNTIKSNRPSLEAKIDSIPKGEILKINIPSGKDKITNTVSINTDRFINNIFEMFNNTYNNYCLVFNNIEEAFKDEIFLEYLANEDVDKGLIPKLLKINYMTPYVARLVTKKELIKEKIVTNSKFLEIVEKLLMEDSFVKHLKRLLEQLDDDAKLKSILDPDDKRFDKKYIRVKFYKQICDFMIKNDVSIANMHSVFKNEKFTNGIFGALLKEIDPCSPTKEKGDAVKLVLKIIKLLNNIAIDLYYNTNKIKELESALKLLDGRSGAKKVREILKKDNLIKENDLDILQAQRTIAKIYNRLGELENNSDKKKVLYKQAYNILNGMTSKMTNSLGSLFPLYLLTLSDLAYTHHLRHECSDAYKKYKSLFRDMMKYVLNLSDSELSEYEWSVESYYSIDKSEAYHIIRKESRDSFKYLNILKIKSDMANELKCVADSKEKCLKKESQDFEIKLNEVVQNFQNALKIYMEVYEVKKADEKLVLDIVKTIRAIAFIHNRLGHLNLCYYRDEEKLSEALFHFKEVLEKYFEIEKIMLQEKWKTHPAVLQIKQDILSVKRDIAYVCSRLGCLKNLMYTKALQFSIEALTKYEELLNIQEEILGEEHEYTLNTMNDIAHVNNNLAKLKLQNYPEEALKFYEEAITKYKKVLEIQKKTLSENHSKITATSEKLMKTEIWRDALLRKINQPRQ